MDPLSITKPTPGGSFDQWGSINNAALDAIVSAVNTLSVVAPKTITTTTYTLILSDLAKGLIFTHASGCAVTIPLASAVVFPSGWQVELRQAAGPVTVVAPTGVTVTRQGTLISGGVGVILGLANYGTNLWWLSGETTA